MISSLSLVPLLLGAALPPNPSIGQSIVYQINGLIVVFIALGSIWGLLELLGRYFTREAVERKHGTPSASGTPTAVALASPAAASRSESLTPETIALIAAAVHAKLGANHRIEAIVPVRTSSDLADEGRRHQVR
jgi:hypothetical protein